jgi:hypothetical protein
MPFGMVRIGPNFNQQFKPGDVIYGCGTPRERYFNSLPEGFRKTCFREGNFTLIDFYNDMTFSRPWNDDSGGLKAPETIEAIRYNLAENTRGLGTNVDRRQRLVNYYAALTWHPRYAPRKTVTTDASNWLAKGNTNMARLVLRRASKFGIAYVIDNLKCTIHFALEHPTRPGWPLDFNDVAVEKRFPGYDHVSITISELRCCYRRRDIWGPTGRLKFYFGMQQVEAPWISHKAEWDVYEQYLQTKWSAQGRVGPHPV